MNYETPELTTLMPAINAIQTGKTASPAQDNIKDTDATYQDWED